MLLAIDVGNTNITLGLFKGTELSATFRLTTKQKRTSDEFGMSIHNLIGLSGLEPADVSDVIISSVVPDIMYSLCAGLIKYIHREPITVGPGVRTGIRITTGYPQEIGADRIVDAVAAYSLYGGPVLVIDFGTATTYDYVTADGSFTAGITAPGIRTSAKALWTEAARLPEFEIRKPDTILARETISSLQAGLVYGYIGSVEYIIRRVKEETGCSDLKTVATGGFAQLIINETDQISVFNKDLTLTGLRLVYEKNI